MITFTDSAVRIPVAVAVALLEFASKDATRQSLGVGLVPPTRGGPSVAAVAATDGHAACAFRATDATQAPAIHARAVWTHSHVTTLVKIARATKADSVTLEYARRTGGSAGHNWAEFPPLEAVMPKAGVTAAGPIGVDPGLLARMAKVTKACGAKGVRLVSANGSLDPLGFEATGNGLDAAIAIMPMRI